MSTFADDLKNKTQKDSRPLTEHEALERGIKHIARSATISFGILFAGITSCGIVAELTDEADLRGQGVRYEGEAMLAEAKGKQTLAEVELTRTQNDSIVDLIDMGINPIAARCAIIGWTTTNDDVCLALVKPLQIEEALGLGDRPRTTTLTVDEGGIKIESD